MVGIIGANLNHTLKFLIISTVNSWFLIDSNAPTALDILISAVHNPSSL
jgi:hypothetical protein